MLKKKKKKKKTVCPRTSLRPYSTFLHSMFKWGGGEGLESTGGWTVSSGKHAEVLTPGPYACGLIWKIRWDHSGLHWALNPVSDILIRRRRFWDTQRHGREEGQLKTEAEIGFTLHQPRSHGAATCGRGKDRFSPGAFRGLWPHQVLDFGLLPPELWENKCLLFKATQSVVLRSSSCRNY